MPQNALTLPGGGVFDAFSSARQNALLQQQAQMQAQDQQMAAQEQRGMANTQGKIEGALMSGDRDAARTLAQGSNNAELMRSTYERMEAQDLAQAEEGLRTVSSAAIGMLREPQANRPQFAASDPAVVRALEGMGIPPETWQDPAWWTDGRIDRFIAQANEEYQVVTNLLDRTAPVTLGENDTRVDPVTGQQTIGQAGEAARALEAQANETALMRASQPRGPLVTVNSGNEGPQVGTIPSGYQMIRDPESGAYRMEPIPGGPAAAELADQDARTEGRQEQVERAGSTVLQDINRALTVIERSDRLGVLSGPTVGPVSGQLRHVPGTPAFEVRQLVESALSNVGLDTLQTMRENSPTGGALGQVPIQQQRRLEQVLGSLSVEQNPQVMRDNLRRVFNIYMDIVYGTPADIREAQRRGEISPQDAARYSERYELSFDELGRPREVDASAPSDVAPPMSNPQPQNDPLGIRQGG